MWFDQKQQDNKTMNNGINYIIDLQIQVQLKN